MHKMVVLAKAVDGCRDELRAWYDGRHIPDLLDVPGVVSAERHDVQLMKVPDGTIQWDFLLIYEFAGDDPMLVLRAMGERQGTERMHWSDALDSSSTVSMIGLSASRRAATTPSGTGT